MRLTNSIFLLACITVVSMYLQAAFAQITTGDEPQSQTSYTSLEKSTFQVVDKEGKPVPNTELRLYVYGTDKGIISATDSRGNVTFDWVPASKRGYLLTGHRKGVRIEKYLQDIQTVSSIQVAKIVPSTPKPFSLKVVENTAKTPDEVAGFLGKQRENDRELTTVISTGGKAFFVFAEGRTGLTSYSVVPYTGRVDSIDELRKLIEDSSNVNKRLLGVMKMDDSWIMIFL